ncbi:hypothetical protein [Streptomyces sp. NPDC006267]|uniref:hypothetical protein n=1 Tax=Streptomyces sp. NPDC006267 TaxID=3157173 RepID=UPI0033AAD67C
MSLHLTVRCDRSGPTGLCQQSLQTGTDDEPEAIDIATHAGWDMGGDGVDHCPNHAP